MEEEIRLFLRRHLTFFFSGKLFFPTQNWGDGRSRPSPEAESKQNQEYEQTREMPREQSKSREAMSSLQARLGYKARGQCVSGGPKY